jgi:hypothetical protein
VPHRQRAVRGLVGVFFCVLCQFLFSDLHLLSAAAAAPAKAAAKPAAAKDAKPKDAKAAPAKDAKPKAEKK